MIDLTAVSYLIALPLIFFAGFMDSIAGGGGLISLPVYLFVGLPPHFALGTNKFSSCWGTLFATSNYYRNKLIDFKTALISAAGALLGSWLGTRTVLMISPDFLNYILVILIPVIAVIFLINQKLGMKDLSAGFTLHRKLWLGLIAGLSIGFYDGFFGPGTGTFLILFFTLLLKYDFITANANTKVVNLASNIAAVITFAFAGRIYYPLAIPAAFCGILGNLCGSKLVILKGSPLIRQIFFFALAILLIRIIFNLFRN